MYIQYQHDGNRRASVSQLWTSVKNFSRYDHIITQCGRRPNKQLNVRSSRWRMSTLRDSAHAELPAEMALSLSCRIGSLAQNWFSRSEINHRLSTTAAMDTVVQQNVEVYIWLSLRRIFADFYIFLYRLSRERMMHATIVIELFKWLRKYK